jgi:hypothetical protein
VADRAGHRRAETTRQDNPAAAFRDEIPAADAGGFFEQNFFWAGLCA